MMILALLLSVVLGVVAVIHAAWGFGIWVPIRNEDALVRAAVGAAGVTRMPGPIPCFLVVAGLLVVLGAIWMQSGVLRGIVLWAAAVVFLGRGAMAYARFWRKMAPVEPFATYDRRYYGPLSLVVGVGLLVIVSGGF
ncbi:DUF3995 domain-containing protein [Yoonia sp.]|uniref:DUF3995 domain-containing protein n=1 Tax=Yoonia sp. TaxID=2212373 RepID=UPI0019F75504|nr:DUF3995 domain-containing protein [Yoonia sp.]MBE0412107.1 DUF3995 domain-containing protein [Yoonia sp.]